LSLNYSNTKIVTMAVRAHAHYSYMLSADEYWTMLNLKTIAEIAEFLKGTKAYSRPLSKLTPSTTHRTMLENNLRSTLFYEMEQFLGNLENEGEYKFFLCMMRRFESDHLKNIFRRNKGHDLEREVLYAFLKHIPGSDVPYSRLIDSANYEELLSCLSNTPYYEVLKEPVEKLTNGETESLFETETAIDHYVETGVFNSLKLLCKTDREYLLPIFGSRIDMYNIYNLYRCIHYYSMTTDDIMSALIPVYYRINPDDLRAIAEAETEDMRVEILKKKFACYSKYFETDALSQDRELVTETQLQRACYIACQKAFKSGTPGFHTSICYFMMRLYEIKDLVKIIEAVRYGCTAVDAAKYLIRPVLDGGASKWL